MAEIQTSKTLLDVAKARLEEARPAVMAWLEARRYEPVEDDCREPRGLPFWLPDGLPAAKA